MFRIVICVYGGEQNMKLTLKQARMMREKTQQDMANFLGVHLNTYQKLEQNQELITIRQAKMISFFLELNVDDIFFNDNSMKRIS